MTVPLHHSVIAAAYDRAPRTGKLQHHAYRALARYVDARYADAVADGWQFVHEYTGEAPNLILVARDKILPVYDAAHNHSELSDHENFMFRAVHDVFGHVAAGAPFGYQGEIVAAKEQLRDLASWPHLNRADLALAQLAAWGEIVGQAAYYETHGKFPEQKA